MIVRVGKQFEVRSRSGRPFGRYRTRAAAERRLAQLEEFKHIAKNDLRASTAHAHGTSTMAGRIRATAQQVLAHRFVSKRAPRRRVPRAIPPTAIEREYGAALRKIARRARAAFAPLLAALPDLVASALRDRRADAGETKRVAEMTLEGRRVLLDSVQPHEVEALARQFADRVSTHQRTQLARQTKAALGIDVFASDRRLGPLVDAFVDSNVGLVRDIGDKTASGIERATMAALTSGTRHEDLAVTLDKQFSLGETRAELIARDQVGKLYGQITASRHKEIGVDKFTWQTAGDERVRDEHEALDGQTFSYDDPPDEGLPGEPILCRCSAYPSFESIDNEVDSDDESDNSDEG